MDASSPPKVVLDLAPSLQRGYRLVDAGELLQLFNALFSAQANITATGTTAANSTRLTAANNVVTVTAAGAGVDLPNALPGMTVTVFNNSAGAVLVWPLPGQQTIPLGSATPGTASISLATLTTAVFVCNTLGIWQRLQ